MRLRDTRRKYSWLCSSSDEGIARGGVARERREMPLARPNWR
jgi:hypothetical protein